MPSRSERARADHERPWTDYAPADDRTGGTVDQADLSRLMRSPTKATAATVYERQIEYWLDKGPDMNVRVRRGLDDRVADDPRLAAIADSHWCAWPPGWLDRAPRRIRLHFRGGP